MSWDAWLSTVWPSLLQGYEAPVPPCLTHVVRAWPSPRVAANVGQSGNHALSCSDGARLHAHVFADGSMILHRDRIDPARSPVHAVWHVLSETPTGRGLVKGAAVGLALRMATRLLL